MELSYLNPVKSLIVAHLDAGEELGDLKEGTGYIRVDSNDPNYLALLEKDPLLETVVDHGAPRMPAPATPTPEQQKMIDEGEAAAKALQEKQAQAAAPAPAKPAPAAPARPGPAPARR